MNIVMLEPLGVSEARVMEAARPLLDQGHNVVYCDAPIPTVEEKIARARDAEAIIIANGKLAPEVILGLPDLKMISVGFTGIDHVPVDLCRERGIRICNAQGYATDATAELALALMLATLRNLVVYDDRARHGQTKAGFTNHVLTGKTVGIVGTGAIGLRLAELLQPFHCELLGYSRSRREAAEALGLTYVSKEELLGRSDIVSLHVPLTEATEGLMDAAALRMMKPGAVLINCARGAVVDSEALAQALDDGHLAGAGIDVLETEPPFPKDHVLLHAPNVTVTPHVGFFSEASLADRIDIVMNNIVQWLRGTPINVKV
ncbi:MAG: NAD(P)-dependent oxidoreductase [Saccharofermentanales bacterium]|jgi:phosphoglycerate dehydrogenase-like enzyme